MTLRRGPWVEFETEDDELVLVHPGWTNDTESLAVAVRETGWYATTREAMEAVERAELSWGWIGADEDGTLRQCDAAGVPFDASDVSDLSDVETVTFSRLEKG